VTLLLSILLQRIQTNYVLYSISILENINIFYHAEYRSTSYPDVRDYVKIRRLSVTASMMQPDSIELPKNSPSKIVLTNLDFSSSTNQIMCSSMLNITVLTSSGGSGWWCSRDSVGAPRAPPWYNYRHQTNRQKIA
jgi:hypothetical protein